MGFLDKIIGSVLVGVFVLALVMFGYSAQIENDVTDTILNDEHFAGINDSFSSTLGEIRGDAETQRTNFEDQEPQIGGDDTFGLFTWPRSIAKFSYMMFSSCRLVTSLLEDVFGIPSIVFNVLGGLLMVVMLVLGWRVLKAGGT